MARVGHADAKPSLGRGRIERDLPSREAPQRLENFPARPDQRVRLWGRRHAARRSNEERIVQVFPQVPKPNTNGRLTLAELLRDARDVAYVVQKVEKLEQLQIGQVGGNHCIIVHGNTMIVAIELPT